MKTTKMCPIEILHGWDELCREFGCSEEQIRELYFLAGAEFASPAELDCDPLAEIELELAENSSTVELDMTEALN